MKNNFADAAPSTSKPKEAQHENGTKAVAPGKFQTQFTLYFHLIHTNSFNDQNGTQSRNHHLHHVRPHCEGCVTRISLLTLLRLIFINAVAEAEKAGIEKAGGHATIYQCVALIYYLKLSH